MTEKPKPRRRWFQFSLGTVLFCVTAFCCELGYLAYELREADRQHSAVEFIEAADGGVVYDDQFTSDDIDQEMQSAQIDFRTKPPPPGPKWVRRLLGDDFSRNVVGVIWHVKFIEDGDTRERRLDVRSFDETLAHLQGMRKLEWLCVVGFSFSDAEMEKCRGLTRLKSLDISITTITGAGLAHLQSLRSLEVLCLQGPSVADDGMVHLKGLCKLRKLTLSGTEITDLGLANLQGLTRLEFLWLNGTYVTDFGLACLRGMTELRELNLKATMVTDAGCQQLKKSLPKLEITR